MLELPFIFVLEFRGLVAALGHQKQDTVGKDSS